MLLTAALVGADYLMSASPAEPPDRTRDQQSVSVEPRDSLDERRLSASGEVRRKLTDGDGKNTLEIALPKNRLIRATMLESSEGSFRALRLGEAVRVECGNVAVIGAAQPSISLGRCELR